MWRRNLDFVRGRSEGGGSDRRYGTDKKSWGPLGRGDTAAVGRVSLPWSGLMTDWGR